MSFLNKPSTLSTVIAITLFWIVMMSILYKREFLSLDASRINQPVEMVARKILEYPEMTELTIYQGQNIIGYVRMNPKLQAGSNSHPDSRYHCLFSTELKLPLLNREFSLNTSFRMDFDRHTRLLSFEGHGKSSDLHFQASGTSLDNRIKIKYGYQGLPADQSLSLPFAFDTGLPDSGTNLSPEYQQIAQDYRKKTTIEAYSIKTIVGDEKVMAYVIESKMDGSNLLKIWVTRFGQVYKIETPYGIEVRASEVL